MSNYFILNYHLITSNGHFDVRWQTLDLQFKLLKSFFNVVPLEEICSLKVSNTLPKRTTVAVTFDDGYLDTYVCAVPLCKKHSIKATVFPIASRICSNKTIHPTLDDYWSGKVAYRDLYKAVPMSVSNTEYLTTGSSSHFMSVEELERASKIIDVGSHASVHAQVFFKDELIDFYDIGNENWSLYYAYDEAPVRGFPIFPNKNNISVQRGFLRPDVKKYIRSIDQTFFGHRNWKDTLRTDLLKKFDSLLTFETVEEQTRRVEEEVVSSKLKIENILGKKLHYFAYPYGHHDPVLVQTISRHFDAAFTTDLDIIRKENNIHLLPRTKVHKDIFTFIKKMLTYSRRK